MTTEQPVQPDPENEVPTTTDKTSAIDEAQLIITETPTRTLSWPIALALAALAIIILTSFALNLKFLFSTDVGPITQSEGPLWAVLILLALISIFSAASSFWLYYGRVLLLKDGPALVPEKWGQIINTSTKKLFESQSLVYQSVVRLMNMNTSQEEQGQALLKSFLTLQEALDRRDLEIKRLQEGYDTKIFKRFLSRFIRVDRVLLEMAEEAKEDEHGKNYKYLSRMMEDALDECCVERYSPELGNDYREASKNVADEPKVIDTDDQEKDFKIAAVDSEGYVVRGVDDTTETIVQARVSIYRVSDSCVDAKINEDKNDNE